MVDKIAGRHGTKAVAQAYLEFLYTPEGQEIVARHYFRPRLKAVADKHAAQFPKMTMFTIDQAFGGWAKSAGGALRRRRRLRPDLRGREVGSPMAASPEPRDQGRRGRMLPGFGLSMGITITYLTLVILIPLATLLLKTATLTWAQFFDTITAPRTLAAYRLSFGAALVAALVNAVFGLLVAWVLERYRFPAGG